MVQGGVGLAFIQALAGFTGADVASSDDLTGTLVQGGDSLLEVTSGLVQSDVVTVDDIPTAEAITNYWCQLANSLIEVLSLINPLPLNQRRLIIFQ